MQKHVFITNVNDSVWSSIDMKSHWRACQRIALKWRIRVEYWRLGVLNGNSDESTNFGVRTRRLTLLWYSGGGQGGGSTGGVLCGQGRSNKPFFRLGGFQSCICPFLPVQSIITPQVDRSEYFPFSWFSAYSYLRTGRQLSSVPFQCTKRRVVLASTTVHRVMSVVNISTAKLSPGYGTPFVNHLQQDPKR